MVSPIKSQSSKLIVGSEILDRFLITDGEAENLKHATYDLTIGEIFPVDKEGRPQHNLLFGFPLVMLFSKSCLCLGS